MNLFRIYFDDSWALNFSMHWVIYSIGIAFIIFWIYTLLKRRWLFQNNIEIESAEIGIQGQKLKIRPNYTNIDIAYKIWVELNTRKIGLKIDFEHDLISEIYNSWYHFFGITRELIKSLPATKIRFDKDSKELIEISTKILNEGLRPHLTEWHAKYYKWYKLAVELNENNDKSPQEIQRTFQSYELLKTDMIRINNYLINYKNVIYRLAFGE